MPLYNFGTTLRRRGGLAGPSGPPAGFSDTFNRADSGTLGVSSSGHTWEVVTAGFAIATNKANKTTLSAVNVINATVADCYMQVDYTVVGVEQNIVFRLTDASNYLMLTQFAGALELFRRVAGADTLITSTAVAGSDTGTHTLKISGAGSTVKAFLDGVEKISVTETHNQTATKHGIGGNANHASDLTSTYDNVVCAV